MGTDIKTTVDALRKPNPAAVAGSGVRAAAIRLLRARHQRLAQQVAASAQPAVVFAPHPDDETLGCGGTILLKRQCGAPVRIVFLTDGSASHPGGRTLARTRQYEGQEAANCLGVSSANLDFLGFADMQLWSSREAAIRETERLLFAHRPQEIFLPYQADPNPDHQAANRIVRNALTRLAARVPGHLGEVQVYEFPLWFWHHWPFVNLLQDSRRGSRAALSQSARAWSSLALFRHFRQAVPVASVLDQKWKALKQHHTQMEAPPHNLNWPTLPGVAGGDFLDCFFQPVEIFHHFTFQA
jgi:LmbE family N-acetylglucosaminyl deacetylase